MVLLSGHGERLPGERGCPAPAAAKEMPGAQQGPAGAAQEPDQEREEEEEEDCEEYEDFSELPDTCSIASDDSFYPPGGLDDDDEDIWSLEGDERDSPEALSLFRACCTNNSIVLKALIRQGPQEEEVREADRNRRVSIPRIPRHPPASPGIPPASPGIPRHPGQPARGTAAGPPPRPHRERERGRESSPGVGMLGCWDTARPPPGMLPCSALGVGTPGGEEQGRGKAEPCQP